MSPALVEPSIPSSGIHTTQHESFPAVHPPAVLTTPSGDIWPRPYLYSDGLRRVAPYHYTYNTYCKQRWRGRTILDIFAAEFRDRDREYYRNAIEAGQIAINGEACGNTETIVKNGDVISHTLHRHEPPVTAQPIKTIAEDDDMIVINKPAGVPVHPAGRYKFNSVVEIMRAERAYAFNPLPCNRLDRLTSGVMFIGRNPRAAEKMSEKLRGRTVRKEYVARVKGRFPDGEGTGARGGDGRGGVVKCEESILQISPVLGLNRARASGKPAKTLFRRIAYYPPKATLPNPPESADPAPNGTLPAQPAPPQPTTENEGYSIVQCLPLTGRTHQIRVHLQFLGHPITNDPIYSNRKVFGPSLGQNDSAGDDDAEVIKNLSRMGKTELTNTVESDNADSISTLIDQTQQMTVSEAQSRSNRTDSGTRLRDPADGLPQGTLHAGPLPSASTHTPGADHTPKEYSQHLDLTLGYHDPQYGALIRSHDEQVAAYNRRKGEKQTGQHCPVCHTPLYSDPGPHDLGIYLHALAYSDLDGAWAHRSPPPDWAGGNGTGALEIAPWQDSDLGWEKEGVGDERDWGRRRNRNGMVRNREMGGDGEEADSVVHDVGLGVAD